MVEEAKPAGSRRGRKSIAATTVTAQEEPKPAEPSKRGRKSLAVTSATAAIEKKPTAVKIDTYSYEDSDENALKAESTEAGKKKRKSTTAHETSVATATSNVQVNLYLYYFKF